MARKPKNVNEPQPQTSDAALIVQQTARDGRAVGIKDIARALGISIGTVDRAIHSRGGINAITKERVLKMAQTLGYKPNLAARYLKAPRQVRLAVNLPARIASFFDAVRAGIRDASSPFHAGVDLHFRTHPALGEGDEELFREALDDGSKGIIIAPGHPAQLKVWIRRAAQRRIPVVCVSTDAPGTERLTAVSADPFVSGAMVAELLHLVVRESGTIGVFTGDLSTIDHSEKVRGFKHSLSSLNGSLSVSGVIETHDDETAAYSQARKLLARDRSLKAVYVSTANSITIIQALEELDPERRISVVTTDLFPQLVPFLKSGRIMATIYQRPEAQGRMAFEALYHFLVEGKCPPHQMKLNPHIVMRSNLELFLDRISVSSQVNSHERVS
jgi:LacI family transcriptional regulator, galactose operon repressor